MALLSSMQQLSLLVFIIHNEWIWCPRLMKPDLLNPTAVSLNVYFIWACTHMKRHLHPTAVFCSSYHCPHYPSGHAVFSSTEHRVPAPKLKADWTGNHADWDEINLPNTEWQGKWKMWHSYCLALISAAMSVTLLWICPATSQNVRKTNELTENLWYIEKWWRAEGN